MNDFWKKFEFPNFLAILAIWEHFDQILEFFEHILAF